MAGDGDEARLHRFIPVGDPAPALASQPLDVDLDPVLDHAIEASWPPYSTTTIDAAGRCRGRRVPLRFPELFYRFFHHARGEAARIRFMGARARSTSVGFAFTDPRTAELVS
jgi:hypothetical protein